jgi:hypothetical protein
MRITTLNRLAFTCGILLAVVSGCSEESGTPTSPSYEITRDKIESTAGDTFTVHLTACGCTGMDWHYEETFDPHYIDLINYHTRTEQNDTIIGLPTHYTWKFLALTAGRTHGVFKLIQIGRYTVEKRIVLVKINNPD